MYLDASRGTIVAYFKVKRLVEAHRLEELVPKTQYKRTAQHTTSVPGCV